MKSFWGSVLNLGTANAFIGLVGVAGFFATFFVPATVEWQWKAAWCLLVFVAAVAAVFAFAAARHHRELEATKRELEAMKLAARLSTRLAVRRQVPQTGSTAPGDYIIVFENPGFIREGAIVTLFSPSSGADQPIALLQVTRVVDSEPLQAKAYPLGTFQPDIGSYFLADNTTTLYVTPMVHAEMLRQPESPQLLAVARVIAAELIQRADEQKMLEGPN